MKKRRCSSQNGADGVSALGSCGQSKQTYGASRRIWFLYDRRSSCRQDRMFYKAKSTIGLYMKRRQPLARRILAVEKGWEKRIGRRRFVTMWRFHWRSRHHIQQDRLRRPYYHNLIIPCGFASPAPAWLSRSCLDSRAMAAVRRAGQKRGEESTGEAGVDADETGEGTDHDLDRWSQGPPRRGQR